MKNWEERERNDLKAINGEKTAKDAFLETSTQHNDVILFIHGDSILQISISDPHTEKIGLGFSVLSLSRQSRLTYKFRLIYHIHI